jgi:hypothetical protein
LLVRFSLLSPGLRSEWLEVPASRKDPKLGTARVCVRELPAAIWDLLWTDLLGAERESAEAAKALTEATTPEARDLARKRLVACRDAERYRGTRLLRACVVDHDASSFAAEVPPAKPGSPLYAQILSALIETGYSPDEAARAAQSGRAERRFGKGVLELDGQRFEGADEATVRFYEACQPDNSFASLLTLCAARYQQGELLTPQAIWQRAGVLPLAPAGKEESP